MLLSNEDCFVWTLVAAQGVVVEGDMEGLSGVVVDVRANYSCFYFGTAAGGLGMGVPRKVTSLPTRSRGAFFFRVKDSQDKTYPGGALPLAQVCPILLQQMFGLTFPHEKAFLCACGYTTRYI